ncbi:MAG: FAD-binding protein [Deltaproteobacteria bacterium]|nr:FAD-binding protein [Candidatus Anaeroferrophillus wilburensis]MBN2887753.1 FAD-binding protein [Deltaproteobacteria bacterium]
MKHCLDLVLSPEDAATKERYLQHIARALKIHPRQITYNKIIRRSVDARRQSVKVNIRVLVWHDELPPDEPGNVFTYPDVHGKTEVHIIGAGPGGLFAGLRLIELGYKPVILERGKDVKARRHDIAAIYQQQQINPDSNFCFGEGGAGTFSDGKLYTRSKKRGSVQKILEVLHFHGASEDILIEAHPHIGTNKLPAIVQALRGSILAAGGEIHYNSRVEEFLLTNNRLSGIKTQNDTIPVQQVILAAGHSARTLFTMMSARGITLEAKPFAMGVRVEHPQELIDRLQYHGSGRGDYLPAAAYALATQVAGRGVYSFCMCPGGYIVPAATSDMEIVVNGMSSAARHSKYANAGMVVEIQLCDIPQLDQDSALAGLQFQQELEQHAKLHGGGGQIAPAQRITDFVSGRLSQSLPDTSYHPGTSSSPLHEWLPEHIARRLAESFKAFDRRMKGFLTSEAVILGVESRTSSPVRIPRNHETLQHIHIANLYPCGEGAGYAGGIVSSAIDGERCAEAVCKNILQAM